MRSTEEIWSLYLEGDGDKLEVEELAQMAQECRSLVKSPVWAALVKAGEYSDESGRTALEQPIAHGEDDPIRRVLQDEFVRGQMDASKRFIALPETWRNEIQELIEEIEDESNG